MKLNMFLLAIAMILILLTGASFGGSMTHLDSAIERGETNLLIALNSDNYGLQASAAQILGDLKCDEAVIPLMRILHNSSDENMRVLAAYSLYKIQNPIGMYAVKQAIRFDNSSRVRKMCTNYYLDSMRKELAAAKQRSN
jgi:hypothetical protein